MRDQNKRVFRVKIANRELLVVDRQTVFVSSANFTEAAQKRNLEIGLLIRSGLLASQLAGYLEQLLASNLLVMVRIQI